MKQGLAIFFLVCGLVRAQAQNPPIIHVDVNLVQVDAVVTDSRNRHVANLKAEDFVILQDGKPQTITNFSYIGSSKPVTPAALPPTVARSGAAAPAPVVPLKAVDVRRTFALVVDDLGLSFTSIAHVRDALRQFVDRQMQPGDLVAIIRTSGGLGVLQQFTSDKNLLHAAIDHVRFTIGRVGVDSFAPVGELTDPRSLFAGGPGAAPPLLAAADPDAEITQLRGQMFTVGTLGALRYVIEGLRDMPGRKSVVLFSESLDLSNMSGELPGGVQGAGIQPIFLDQVQQSMRRLVDGANRASVVIYTIDPRGLQVFFPGAADKPAKGGMAGQIMQDREGQMFDSQTGLWTLALETGGLFIHNDNFIDDAVNQAIADSEGYYLIGYRPAAETFDAKTGDAKFHNLQVKLKSAGLQVRSRSGFFGESDAQARAVPRPGHEELLHALTSPFSSGAVPMRLTALFEQASDGRPFLSAMLHIDAKDVKFAAQPDGGRKARLEVIAMTFGQSGQPLGQSDRHFEIALNAQQYAASQSGGLVYRVNQPLQKSGMYQLRVALRDEDSGELGSASQFMETPDLSNGRLALSSILLAENTSRPKESAAEGRIADSDPTASAAERVFKPGAPLAYRYTIFNAQTNAAGKTDLQVQTRIYRDGKPVYQGQPLAPDLAGQSNPKRLVAGGNMVLARAIPPGDYVLQVIVTDKLAKQKYQIASQWMDFEVKQ
jgi:VWFA-related protein